jgi:hypothetical protein
MADPHLERTVGGGDYTAVLWCDGRAVVLAGLERFPEQGDQFEIESAVWVVVEDNESHIEIGATHRIHSLLR